MTKGDDRRARLRKLAKRRASRPVPAAPPTPSRSSSPAVSAERAAMEVLVSVVLEVDLRRSDLNDRSMIHALKNVRRGASSSDPVAQAVQESILAACQASAIETRVLHAAIDQLLEVVQACDRTSPRVALTLLHSLSGG